ncbi:hypothetical protein BKA65DRAFT_543276 [Rhexocercosporidium sp. MPI-PUGE-AT-0058]|nr:hypothetical protein BKA65DRAFT_543276 [Rhexocercosporidium sp. MPI-PUGE-AT-0058]
MQLSTVLSLVFATLALAAPTLVDKRQPASTHIQLARLPVRRDGPPAAAVRRSRGNPELAGPNDVNAPYSVVRGAPPRLVATEQDNFERAVLDRDEGLLGVELEIKVGARHAFVLLWGVA